MTIHIPATIAATVHIGLFSGWDYVAFVYSVTLMLLNSILFFYAALNHRYPPLKAKNMPLISILYLCMLIWFFGILGTNFNLPNTFDLAGSCLWFGSWFRVLLGIFLFIHIHVLRLYIYIRIFSKMKKVTYKVYVVTICTYLFILIAYGIPTTVLHKTLTVEYVAELRVCRYGRVFTELSFSLVWVGWAVMLLVTFLARNINTSFKEYREMLAICLIASMAIAYQTVVHHVVRNYLIVRWTRVTSTMMEMTACQISLFILVGVPAYNCLFHKEDYKKRWYTKMRADGMTARYGFEPSQTSNDNHVNSNADNSNTNTSSTLLSSSAAKV